MFLKTAISLLREEEVIFIRKVVSERWSSFSLRSKEPRESRRRVCGITLPLRDSERPGCRSPSASPHWWSSQGTCCRSDHRNAASCLTKRKNTCWYTHTVPTLIYTYTSFKRSLKVIGCQKERGENSTATGVVVPVLLTESARSKICMPHLQGWADSFSRTIWVVYSPRQKVQKVRDETSKGSFLYNNQTQAV